MNKKISDKTDRKIIAFVKNECDKDSSTYKIEVPFINSNSANGKLVFKKNIRTDELIFKKINNNEKFIIVELNGVNTWKTIPKEIKEKSVFYHFDNKSNLKINILRVPIGIDPIAWYYYISDFISKSFNITYPIKNAITTVLYDLYEDNDVFEDDLTGSMANERTKNITLKDIYAKLKEKEQTKWHQNEEEIDKLIVLDNGCNALCWKGGNSIDYILNDNKNIIIELDSDLFDDAIKELITSVILFTICETNDKNSILNDRTVLINNSDLMFRTLKYYDSTTCKTSFINDIEQMVELTIKQKKNIHFVFTIDDYLQIVENIQKSVKRWFENEYKIFSFNNEITFFDIPFVHKTER